MSSKDIEIKLKIEKILRGSSVGQNLKTYFENMPDKNVRRAIAILSNSYPDKIIISDDEFEFITCMFSNKKFREQESFFEFVRSVAILHFTENQKDTLLAIIKIHFETLCGTCTFELDTLLMRLFKPHELIQYIEIVIKDGNIAVLQHISDILRYEDFSNSNVSDEAVEMVRREVSQKLQA